MPFLDGVKAAENLLYIDYFRTPVKNQLVQPIINQLHHDQHFASTTAFMTSLDIGPILLTTVLLTSKLPQRFQ